MSDLKILHAADLHLDSAFEALPAGKAALRRSEQRELLRRLAALAQQEKAQLVVLSGDLFDSDNSYYETGEELIRCLTQMAVPVFIAPGNHDYYAPRSPWARLKLPDNVRVYGAAFTEKHAGPLLKGFRAPREEGVFNLLCLHGEVGKPDSPYDPISEAALAESGADYAALGHIHKASGLLRAGENGW